MITDLSITLTKNMSNFDTTMTTVTNINWQGISRQSIVAIQNLTFFTTITQIKIIRIAIECCGGECRYPTLLLLVYYNVFRLSILYLIIDC